MRFWVMRYKGILFILMDIGLGYLWRRDGYLFQASVHVLLQRLVPFKVLERLIGKHGFMHSARPSLRSVFGETYQWLDEQRRCQARLVELPAVVWEELLLSTLLIPYAQFDLSSPWSTRVEATDSSMTGLGRAFTVMPEEVVRTLARYSATKGVYTNLKLPWGVGLDKEGKCPFHKVQLPVRRVRWKKIGVPWNPTHVTLGEADAAVWAAHDRLRRPGDDGCRFVHPMDSAAMIGAFTKGRSSSHSINERCRAMCSINLCGGHEPFYIWTPSAENPADDPSRWFEPQEKLEAAHVSADPDSSEGLWDLRSLNAWPEGAQFFLHLCSGPRRDGDILDCVERFGAAHGHALIGIAIDPLAASGQFQVEAATHFSDLLDSQTGEMLLNLIHSGRVVGAFGSPPCSTISAARHIPLAEGYGPRPIRGREAPWIPLPYCSEKEIQAVRLGSALYLLVLGILGEVRIWGGWTGLEHPADRGAPFPSFFATHEVQSFCKQFSLRYFVTHQCMFGAATKKPTGLLLPADGFVMVQRCSHLRKHPQLKGFDESGGFKTTPAVRYPSEFCSALARCFIRRLDVALSRSYRMPYAPMKPIDAIHFDPWGLGRHVAWHWIEPSPGFLAEHVAAFNNSEIHSSFATPQQ